MQLFIISHLGSRAETVCNSLAKCPYALFHHLDSYRHPNDLITNKNYIKIIYDLLNFNYQLASSSFYKIGYFLFILGSPEESIGSIENYSEKNAYYYYCYRIRRMCEMFVKTDKKLFLTDEEIVKGKHVKLLEDWIGVTGLSRGELYKKNKKNSLSWLEMQKAHDLYLRCLKVMKN